jgi:hypothetical protein
MYPNPAVLPDYKAIMLKVDDFPAPLGPRRPITSPRLIPKVLPATARSPFS